MQAIFDFVAGNLLACIIAFVAIIILIVIIVAVIVTNINKNSRDELEKMLNNVPATVEEEVAATDNDTETKRTGDADLKWVREQSFGIDDTANTSPTDKPEQLKMDLPNLTKEVQTMAKTDTVKTTTNEVNNTKVSVKASEQKQTAKTVSSSTKLKEAAKKLNKDSKPPKKVLGKWVIREKGEGEFVAYLHANNGEIVLTSEIYSSADGAKKGVATIQKSIAGDSFQLYCDKNRNYYFKLKNAQNRFLCVGETYPTKASCLSAIESVKRFCESPVSDTVEKDLTVIKYIPAPEKPTEKKNGYSGKWVVVEVEGMFIAQLYASNGELLLSSEAYTSANSAKSSVETITANGIAGNFIIDVDKKGRYFFKLRNAQKSTLCVGETYDQQAKCISAIESVRRFLKTAKLTDEVI